MIEEPITIASLSTLFSRATVNTAVAELVGVMPHIIAAAAFLLFFWILYRATRRPLEELLELRDMDPAIIKLLVRNLYKYALYIFAIILALEQIGVDVTAAVAGVGVAGLAIGFAAKDTIANIIAGITVFWDKPFMVNDLIEVDGQMGLVKEITLRSTRIRTGQNRYVIIPNQRIVDATVVNHSKRGPVRVDITIGIGYKEDPHEARQVLLAMLREDERIMHEQDHPEVTDPEVIVDELADSAVILKLRFWVPDALDQFRAGWDYTEQAKQELNRAGIEIPFPQRVIHKAKD